MRKRKIAAAVMVLAMTAGIGSPVQAAGDCINGNEDCQHIVVGGSCLDGNSVNEILNGFSCSNGKSVKGASDRSNCANVNNSCNNSGNSSSVKKGNDCSDSGNTYKIVIGGNGNTCNSTADIIQKYVTGNGSCGTLSNEQSKTVNDKACQPTTKSSNSCQTINWYGNSCQTVEKNNSACNAATQDITTEQATRQRTSEQKDTHVKPERSTTMQPSTQRATEQMVTEHPTTEQSTMEKENSTEVTAPVVPKNDEVTVGSMSEEQAANAGQVLDIVNRNRSSAGLHSLKLDADLCAAAQIRANEIVSSFSHTRPDGRKFSTVLTDNGIRFTAAGENIAWGQTSPEQVMNAWMNSDGHRANIMNVTYTKLGVGHVTVAGRQYWVQLFSY